MADHDPTIGTEPESRPLARRHMLRGLAGLGAAGVVGVAAAQPAAADDGDPLVLGEANTSDSMTALLHDSTADEPGVDIRTTGSLALYASTKVDGGPPIGNIKRAILAIGGGEVAEFGAANAIGAFTDEGIAVEAVNESDGFPAAVAVNQGSGLGFGAGSFGHGPQLQLLRENASPIGPPSGTVEAGSIRFDGAGDLWLCVADGTPGSWTRLLREDTAPGRTVPIAPFRALDTRATGGRPAGSPAVPGQKKGPLKGGEAITLDLAGVAPIPATTTGVVGNLIAITPNYTGYLRAAPSGSPLTATALSFAPGPNTGNAFTVGLGPDGVTLRGSGTAANTHHLVVDITAYIT